MENLGIEKIVLVFENCEMMEIPGWYLTEFSIRDVKMHICRVACNAIEKYHVPESVLIGIAAEFDQLYGQEDGAFDDTEMSRFDRIRKWHDITSIDIFFEREYVDDKCEVMELRVPYDSEREDPFGAENILQTVCHNEYGDLILAIGYDDVIRQEAERLAKEERDETVFHHDMYDIGEPFELKHRYVKPDGSKDYPEPQRPVWINNGWYSGTYDGTSWNFDETDHPEISEKDIENWQYDRY